MIVLLPLEINEFLLPGKGWSCPSTEHPPPSQVVSQTLDGIWHLPPSQEQSFFHLDKSQIPPEQLQIPSEQLQLLDYQLMIQSPTLQSQQSVACTKARHIMEDFNLETILENIKWWINESTRHRHFTYGCNNVLHLHQSPTRNHHFHYL